MDQIEGLILGAGISAVITVLVTNYFNEKTPVGGGEPNGTAVASANAKGGVLYVVSPPVPPSDAAPVATNTPITEAAYNQAYIEAYVPAFGIETNRPAGQEAGDPLLYR